MGDSDRNWSYNRSNYSNAGSNPRSNHNSSSGINYSYSRYVPPADSGSNVDHGSAKYTRSRSSNTNRDDSYRNRHADFDRSQYNHRESHHRDSYHHRHNSGRSGDDGSNRWKYSRDGDFRANQVPRNNSHAALLPYSQSERSRSDTTSSSHWPRENRSRSPSAYINPFPPQRLSNTSQHSTSSKNSSPPPRGVTSRFRDEPKVPVAADSHHPTWNKPDFGSARSDKRSSVEVFRSKNPLHPQQGLEIEKLQHRLKEYVPWLTARKASIVQFRREKELKEEVDDIDWCLDVIQDIKRDENVGMQTLKRAQDKVMALINKGPITAPKAAITISTIEPRSDGVSRDEIYSARSPSPPSTLTDSQFTRRNGPAAESYPRVIPTDREVYPLSNFPPSRFQGTFNSKRVEPPVAAPSTDFAPNIRLGHPNNYNSTAAAPRSTLSTQYLPTVPAAPIRSISHTNAANTTQENQFLRLNNDSRVYDYGHGQPESTTSCAEEELFERRKPETNYVNNDEPPPKRKADVDPDVLSKKAEMERRMKEWEETSSDEEDVPSRWNKYLDEDLRISESAGATPHLKFSHTHSRSESKLPEEIRSPEPEELPVPPLSFLSDSIKTADLNSRSTLPGTDPASTIHNPAQAQQQQYPPLVPPMNLLNFNQFMSSLEATNIIRQAQLLMGFPSVAAQGAGLLPLPTPNLVNSSSTARFPSSSTNFPQPQVPSVDTVEVGGKTEEEIMMSRIKARAAECFSNRNMNSRSQLPSNGFSSAMDPMSLYNHSSVRASAPSLDPRLKPREPRQPIDAFRFANARTEFQPIPPDPVVSQAPVVEPKTSEANDSETTVIESEASETSVTETGSQGTCSEKAVSETATDESADRYTDVSDSDNDLRIDLSPPPPPIDESDRSEDEDESQEEQLNNSVCVAATIGNVTIASSTQVVENSSAPGPDKEPSKSGPAVSDELIESLLLKSLSTEEAEVLRSSGDYLATALAKLKEELSAKVKERTRQMSGESSKEFDSGTSSTIQQNNAEFKDGEDHAEEDARSRRVTRSSKKVPVKKNELERLHDDLREMNFDPMMPLGRRRNATKTPSDNNLTAEVTQEQAGSEAGKIPTPKLSPVVMLKNCGQSRLRSESLSPSRIADEEMPEMNNVTNNRGRRKRPSRQAKKSAGKSYDMEVSNPTDEEIQHDCPPSKKSRQDYIETDDDNEGAVSLEAIQMNTEPESKSNSEPGPGLPKAANDDIPERETAPLEYINPVNSETELMDLGKELQKNPAEFGLQEDEDYLYKPEDFAITLSDEDIPNLKADEDPGISAEDFVINDLGLGAIDTLNLSSASTCSKDTTTTDSVLLDGVVTDPNRGRGKKQVARGVSAAISCLNCDFFGTSTKIVAHCVNEHPGTTIPQACLTDEAFKSLQERNKSDSPQLMEVRFSRAESIRCIFCNIMLSNVSKYCQHLTGHTGEFRFKCSTCSMKFFAKQATAFHCRLHKKDNTTLPTTILETKLGMEEDADEFYGYVCRECKYFQISSESIREHLDLTKHCETDVVCIKFAGTSKKRKSVSKKAEALNTLNAASKPPPEDINDPGMNSEQPVIPPLLSPSIVFLGEPSTLPESPKFQMAEAPRYKRLKRPRVSYILECCEVSEKLYVSKMESEEPVFEESEADVLEDAKATVRLLLDTLCNLQELEDEIRHLVPVVSTSEAAFSSTPVNMDGSLSIRDINEESQSTSGYGDGSDVNDEEDDAEANDFFGEEVFEEESDSESLDYDGVTFIHKYQITEEVVQSVSNSVAAAGSTRSPQTPLASPRSISSTVLTPSASVHSQTPVSNPPSTSHSCPASPHSDIGLMVDLEGTDLYRCANIGCEFSSLTLQLLKVHHHMSCKFFNPEIGHVCPHCGRRYLTPASFFEHINLHGKANNWCALCSYKGRNATEMKKHLKSYHKYSAVTMIFKSTHCNLPKSCDGLWYPKDILSNPVDFNLIQKNPLVYVPRIQFHPNEIDDIPPSSTLLSEVHCALCSYSTKVRTNMTRHLNLHKWAEEEGSTTLVPAQATVNSVPWLERKEMMFDKMTNWAGSTHNAKAVVSATAKETLPQFVEAQFRYVCSVPSCAQITVDDSMLRAHMKALHSEYDTYMCPHCQLLDGTRSNPLYTVPVDKLGTHLKLHGAKLLKCPHCDFITIRTNFMDKHLVDKHPGLRPYHFVIRGTEDEAGASKRGTGTDEGTKGSGQWRCLTCKLNLSNWTVAKDHARSVHKVKSQFMCDSCTFHSDSIFQLGKHVTSKKCWKPEGEGGRFLVFFSRTELGDENFRLPIWRRVNSRDHLRGIYYLHENEVNVVPETVVTKASSPVKSIQPNPKTPTKLKPSPANRRKQTLPSTSLPKIPSLYACCQCGTYRTKSAENMRTHLRQHLNYHRYTCKVCGNRSWTMNSFKLHVEVDHGELFVPEKFVQAEPKNATMDRKVEAWMLLCLKDPLAPDDDEIIFSPLPDTTPTSPESMFCDEIVILD